MIKMKILLKKLRKGRCYLMLKKINSMIIEEINKMSKNKKYLLIFPTAFLYYEIILRIFGHTEIFRGFFITLLFTLSFGFFFGVLTSFFKNKIRYWSSIVILLVTSIIYIAECLIKESFQMYMTFSDMLSGAGGVVGGFSGELLRAVFSSVPVIVLFLLPTFCYVWYERKMKTIIHLSPWQGSIVLAFVFVFWMCGTLLTSISQYRDLYAHQYKFDMATQTFGLLTGLRLNIQYDIFGNNFSEQLIVSKDKNMENVGKNYRQNILSIDFARLSQTENNKTFKSIDEYVDSLKSTSQNKYTGLFKGKNLILICAEAFSDATIHKELTPTLYRLAHKGIYFSDYYQPAWGGSTSTGEYSFLTGLVPMDGIETMKKTRNNLNYYTLGNQLIKQGYYSMAYHNGSYDYYDRQLTHENLGYSQFLGQGNGLEDIVGAWAGDRTFFDKTMDTYINKEPFSIYYMTLSGHAPYSSNDAKTKKYIKKVKSVLKNQFKETTLNYYCYQMELEEALSVMVEKLEKAGIADDTVICLTSDHYPYGLAPSKTFGNSQDYLKDLYQQEIDTDWDRDHNSWILWSGCLENDQKEYACEINDPTYSLDIVPTLLNLFGVEYDSRLLVGRDVFSDATPLVLWNDHSWITDKGKYDSKNGKFIPDHGVVVSDEYIKNIKNIVSNKITFSKQVLDYDYYRHIFKQ